MQKARWRTASSDWCWLDFNCSAGKVVVESLCAQREVCASLWTSLCSSRKFSMLHQRGYAKGNNAAFNKWTTPVTNWNNNTQDHVRQIIKQQRCASPAYHTHTLRHLYMYVSMYILSVYSRALVCTFIWGTHSFTRDLYCLSMSIFCEYSELACRGTALCFNYLPRQNQCGGEELLLELACIELEFVLAVTFYACYFF